MRAKPRPVAIRKAIYSICLDAMKTRSSTPSRRATVQYRLGPELEWLHCERRRNAVSAHAVHREEKRSVQQSYSHRIEEVRSIVAETKALSGHHPSLLLPQPLTLSRGTTPSLRIHRTLRSSPHETICEWRLAAKGEILEVTKERLSGM